MTNSTNKKTVAVLFGGISVEHDVSILTGLQIIDAIDSTIYDIIPVYIDQNGDWFCGDQLLNRKNYHFSPDKKKELNKISLDLGTNFNDKPYFTQKKRCFFAKDKKLYFDIAFLALHGGAGENGQIQGAFAMANIPFTGCDHFSSSIAMNKAFTKNILRNAKINVLPDILIHKPKSQNIISKKDLLKDIKINFPVCVKPCNLGSSVGVYKANNEGDLYSAVLQIFKIDDIAIIEPFVENLVEYNISVCKAIDEDIKVSAIEQPNSENELLNFKDKYLNDGDNLDNKLSTPTSQGMASSSRTINPSLTKKQNDFIIDSAKKAFSLIGANGAPRIDFLCNKKTKEIWLNEINTLPGSLGYYLWQASSDKINFTKLLTNLINEGFNRLRDNFKQIDLKSCQAAIFNDKN
jgi:D-alanine-D-alanine ligase